MMDYPQRFFQQLFTSFRKLELARRFSVYFGSLLVVILFLVGMLVWAHNSQTVRPYFLYVSEDGEWSVYASNWKKNSEEQPWFVRVQEALVVKYAEDYFNISDSSYENENLWCDCKVVSCKGDSYDKCKVCCASEENLFGKLVLKTAPKWKERFSGGERMRLVDPVAVPVGGVTSAGGLWEVRGNLVSNKNKPVKIFAYIRIGSGGIASSRAVGFRVSQFDFYGDR